MCFFPFLFKFEKKLLYVNSGEPDQTPQSFAASDLVLQGLPMSHKEDTRLIGLSLCS